MENHMSAISGPLIGEGTTVRIDHPTYLGTLWTVERIKKTKAIVRGADEATRARFPRSLDAQLHRLVPADSEAPKPAPRDDGPVPAVGRPGSGRAKVKPGKKEQVGVRFWPENSDRARAAYLNTRAQTGFPSFSDLVEAAVMEYTQVLENAYNGGRPWPPEGPGQAPVGRPRKRQADTGR
jgi:hypothetical protein